MNGRESEAISFAEFDLDTVHRRLSRNGEALAINAKTFDLLTFLIENNGRLISKDEILEAVWPDQFVEEANLSVQISALRKALGEKKGEPRFLVTIPGKGYKFVADVGTTDERFVVEKHHFERVVIDEVIEEPEDLAIGPVKRGTGRTSKLVLAFAVCALLSLAGVFAYRYFSPLPVSQIKSLAVLPFTNQNDAAETEYLSDGLAESVIHSLSRIPEFRVMSRNSAFRYRGNEIDARQIGEELGVDAVLTGRIIRAGDSLSISTELISGRDNSVIWGEQFTRKMSDIGRLQTDIAHAISQRLRLRLSPSARVEPPPVDPEAYRLYLLGRYHIGRLTDEDFFKGRDYFQRAIEKDANYAPAYGGLAEAYNLLSAFNVVPPTDGHLRARPLATKALELDGQLAETHAQLGIVKHYYDWDWAGAETEFKRAIEIDPNNALARMLYGYHLASRLRLDEALVEVKIADQLDPLSLDKALAVGDILYFQHRFDEAIVQYRRIIDKEPRSGIGRWALGNAYVQKGMYREAITEYQLSIPLSGDSPDEYAALAYAYALSGRRADALRIIEDLKRRSERMYIPPSLIAFIYAGLGDKDKAFEWMEKAYIGRDFLMSVLNVEPLFDKLRDDPRFDRLTSRVGLPKIENVVSPTQ